MKLKKILAIFAASIVISPLAYCGIFDHEYSGPEINGTVTNVDTGKPIDGVVVIWKWGGGRSMGFVDAQSVCYRIDFAITDDKGRFSFPAWEFRSNEFPYIRNRYHGPVNLYKPGYESTGSRVGSSGDSTEQLMKSTTGLIDAEKAAILARIYSNTSCTYADKTMTETARAQYIQLIDNLRSDAMKVSDSDKKRFLLNSSAKELQKLKGLKK